jgi:iron-sulfur cluster assembly protein
MIRLSPAAAREVERLRSKQHQSGTPLRLRLQVEEGGCSGLFYVMTFDNAIQEDDYLDDCHGISVVVDPHSLNYIDSLTLDYSEDLMGGGFRFYNPKASQSCSCGNSFSVSNEDRASSNDR